jgi:hypothetical protein
MKQKLSQQTDAYKLDLSETGRDGAFLCPKCGIRISPDDHSEVVYSIYDTVMTNNNLDEVILHCKRCLCFIHLTGLSGVQKTAHPKAGVKQPVGD